MYIYIYIYIYWQYCMYVNIHTYKFLYIYTCIYLSIYLWSEQIRLDYYLVFLVASEALNSTPKQCRQEDKYV